jgi:hypothetical protein
MVRPRRLLSSSRSRIWRKRGMTRASSGTICTTRIITSTVVRIRKAKRATATAAKRARRPEMRTVPRPTSAELRR